MCLIFLFLTKNLKLLNSKNLKKKKAAIPRISSSDQQPCLLRLKDTEENDQKHKPDLKVSLKPALFL